MFIHHRNYRPFDYMSFFIIDQPVIGRFFITDTFGIDATILIYQDGDTGPTSIFKNLNEATDFIYLRSKRVDGYIPIFDSTENPIYSELLSKKLASFGRKILEVSGGSVHQPDVMVEKTILDINYYPGLLNNDNYKIGFKPGRRMVATTEHPIQTCSVTDLSNAFDEKSFLMLRLTDDSDRPKVLAALRRAVDGSISSQNSIIVKHSDDEVTNFLKEHASLINSSYLSFNLKPAFSTMN